MEHVFWGNKELNRNDVSFDDTRWIECWWCTPGNPESNWKDHSIDSLELPVDQFKGSWRLSTAYVPTWLFDGHQEGDIVTFKMPIKMFDRKDDITVNTSAKMSVRLAQKPYRYGSFGRFEEVLKRI